MAGKLILGEWTALVRRARIGRQRKLSALTVASYANPDGTSVRCGVARLAVDLEASYSTARRHLAWLREAGLIELVKAGNRKAKRADEYRLIISDSARERLDVPDDAYRKLVDELSDSNRSRQKSYRMRDAADPSALTWVSADATDAAEPSALTVMSAEPSHQRSFGTPSALTQDERPPSSTTFQEKGGPSTGGAPPPDPRRPQAPPALGTDQQSRRTEPLTPAQDQQGESLPRASIGLCITCAATGKGRNRLVPALPGTDYCETHR